MKSWRLADVQNADERRCPTWQTPAAYRPGMPVLYSGTFELTDIGDTFLDGMEKWGKGIIFVNGIESGRYWKVGPQQTLYLLVCFLKKGQRTTS